MDETLKILNVLYDRNYAFSPIKKDLKVADKKEVKKVSKFDRIFNAYMH
jgi:hypothetical protein